MPTLFTDRRTGTSLAPYESFNLATHVGDTPNAVAVNRALLCEMVGTVQFMNQVHGDSIVLVDEICEAEPTCDALITRTPGLALAVLVADCIPLLLSSTSVVAAVHVGRKGLVSSIALKVVAQMRVLGATAIHAQLGASICGKCYEVPQAMAQEVGALNPAALAFTRAGTHALDLPKALIADLIAQDVSYEASTSCTLEDEMYFSYRRQQITGRNAGVIWL